MLKKLIVLILSLAFIIGAIFLSKWVLSLFENALQQQILLGCYYLVFIDLLTKSLQAAVNYFTGDSDD